MELSLNATNSVLFRLSGRGGGRLRTHPHATTRAIDREMRLFLLRGTRSVQYSVTPSD